MKSLNQVVLSFWNSEEGAILSAELVIVLTIAGLSMIVGLRAVSGSINAELEDVSESFGSISQSYEYSGIGSCHACVAGSSFDDKPDRASCDCLPLNNNVGHIRVQDKCE